MRKINIVVVAAIKKGDRYLLTKRFDPRNKVVHGRWQMPGGGLQHGESIKDCLVREVLEETGLKLKNLKFSPHLYEFILKNHDNQGLWHGIVFVFRCELKMTNPKIVLNGEGSDYGWFSLTELKRMRLHFGTLRALEDLEGQA